MRAEPAKEEPLMGNAIDKDGAERSNNPHMAVAKRCGARWRRLTRIVADVKRRRSVPWIVPVDLHAIYDCHKIRSVAKTGRVADVPVRFGDLFACYEELDSMTLAAGFYHVRRKPT